MTYLRYLPATGILLLVGCVSSDPIHPVIPASNLVVIEQTEPSTVSGPHPEASGRDDPDDEERGPNLMGSGN